MVPPIVHGRLPRIHARAPRAFRFRAALGAIALLMLTAAAPPDSARAPARAAAKPGAKTKASAAPAAKPTTRAASRKATPAAVKVAAPEAASAVPPAPAAPSGPRFSPWSSFSALSPGDQLSLEFRVGAAGEAAGSVSPAIFGSHGQPLEPEAFREFRHAGQKYEPDGTMPFQFTASPEEIAAVMERLGSVPAVAEGRVAGEGLISIALVARTGGTTHGFETVLAGSEAQDAIGGLLGALSGNFPAVTTLRQIGCRTGTLPAAAPESLDARVKLTFSGLRAERDSPSELVGMVTVTNISDSPLPSPLTLIVMIEGEGKLMGADGQTCRAEPAGKPFVNLDDRGGLAFKQSLARNLRFWSPEGAKPAVTFRLVGGAGTR